MVVANLARFLHEAGALKFVKRSGWWLAGVRAPESVAEHSQRAALIAFILARLEGKTRNEALEYAFSLLIHDLPEARLLDLHKVSQRYLDAKKGEARARKEQFALLPPQLKKDFEDLAEKYSSPIARDADLLECAFQAAEYESRGFVLALDWRKRIAKRLKTKSAKRLFSKLGKRKNAVWWASLKK
ncbi:MAG: HD domain-containing protein [Candidatus Norongarragalinales archaeon]